MGFPQEADRQEWHSYKELSGEETKGSTMFDRKELDMRRYLSQGAELNVAEKTIRGLSAILARPIVSIGKALNRHCPASSTRFLLAFILIPIVIVLMGVGVPNTAQAHSRKHKHQHVMKAKRDGTHIKAVHHKSHGKLNIKKAKSSRHRISKGNVMRHKKARHARLMTRHAKHQHTLASAQTGTYNIIAAEGSRETQDPWMVKTSLEKAITDEETPPDAVTSRVLESAHNYLGTPYRYGGTTPEGFDCSGFVRHVFGENGIALSRSSREQILQGKHVALDAIRPGDLIFFGKQRRSQCRIDHVGLYIGHGRFIHAASKRTGYVTISELGSGSYRSRIVSARRIIETP